jgi:hypothetical protein
MVIWATRQSGNYTLKAIGDSSPRPVEKAITPLDLGAIANVVIGFRAEESPRFSEEINPS